MDSVELKEKYDALYNAAFSEIKNEGLTLDRYLDDPKDERKGLSLILQPSGAIAENVELFLSDARRIEPELYVQPIADLHVTVMSIISCREGFDYQLMDLKPYIECIAQSLCESIPFGLQFKGVSLSSEAVMICGFPQSQQLEHIRNRLREHFNTSNLFHTLDIRYKTELAHMTAIRHRMPLRDCSAFLEFIQRYREFDFGTMTASGLQLVETDWYARAKNRVNLHEYRLEI